jgi:plasmid stabilization system protein ParE
MIGYDFHPEALSDLDEIWEYIARESATAAEKVNGDILKAVRALVPFPHQGHRRTDLTSRPLRFWRVYDYLIAYASDEKPLWVVAVLHGNRNPRVLAAILRSRETKVT